jgi:hypothetical protein
MSINIKCVINECEDRVALYENKLKITPVEKGKRNYIYIYIYREREREREKRALKNNYLSNGSEDAALRGLVPIIKSTRNQAD